jgi:hypothetical protein
MRLTTGNAALTASTGAAFFIALLEKGLVLKLKIGQIIYRDKIWPINIVMCWR